MELVWPGPEHLPSYVAALERGWSPDTTRDDVRFEQLAAIEADADAFLASRVDLEAAGPPIPLPDGSLARRLPGYHLWLWDGELCGGISLRWQPGTSELPNHVLGHIGYSVVPWKRRLGYATRALALMLPDAAARGLAYVEVSTDLANFGSQRVIEVNGGVEVERFVAAEFGPETRLRYRIDLVS